MILSSRTENENANFVMPADSLSDPERFNVQRPFPQIGTRNPEQRSTQVRKDASGNIHVNLDSSTPCWNDANRGTLLEMTEVSEPRIFKAVFYRSAMDTVASWLNLPHLAYGHFRRLNNML